MVSVKLRALVFFVIIFTTISACANTLYPLDTAKQDAQFSHLLKELRCLVCQNQDLADSNAGLAKDLRDEVYQMVKTGKSDHEIIQYLTARYGDFILFNPPVKSITALLWFGPALFMALGLLVFWNACLKRTRNE
jgi:cytochrome c-type biogenesis protein CcmH